MLPITLHVLCLLLIIFPAVLPGCRKSPECEALCEQHLDETVLMLVPLPRQQASANGLVMRFYLLTTSGLNFPAVCNFDARAELYLRLGLLACPLVHSGGGLPIGRQDGRAGASALPFFYAATGSSPAPHSWPCNISCCICNRCALSRLL